MGYRHSSSHAYRLLFSALFLFVPLAKAFVAKNSTEATFTFSHYVEIESAKKPSWAQAGGAVDDQLEYLFGPMGISDFPAVPLGDQSVTRGEIIPKEDSPGVWLAHYDYEGTIQVKKGPRTRYTIVLPKVPSEAGIYTKGVVKGINLCTDTHYNSFGDFWYFWNPDLEHCPLEDGVDYDRVKGTIVRFSNSKRTYPEYPRLVDPKTKEIPIFVFLGMGESDEGQDPLTSNDDNAVAYRSMQKALKKMGFTGELMSNDEMRRILQNKKVKHPHVEVYRKEADKGTMVVTLFFGLTQINEASTPFHYFYKEANEKAAVMIYDGHSGLGGNLDLKQLEKLHGFKIKLPKRYQIFFFNSCTSYTYYNSVYFYRKAPRTVRSRTKDLDILTDGLEAAFDQKQLVNLSLIRAVDSWATGGDILDYQDLADKMEDDDLFAVNGDEDNPTKKSQVQ